MYCQFSKSHFWHWQREYFFSKDVEAWKSGEIPHYITSNRAIAQTYASLIRAFWHDQIEAGAASGPYYVIELGAGSGRFSYHLLKALDSLVQGPPLASIRYKYVITDLVENNLEFWKKHPKLQPFVTKGILDFAIYDAEQDQSMTLEHSGKILSPGSLLQPIITIGNYFFDSLPQELLYFHQGEVSEVWVETNETDFLGTISPGDRLKQMELEYSYRPSNPSGQNLSLVNTYQKQLKEAHVMIPEVGISCVEKLKVLSKRGMLLLCADKAVLRIEDWEGRGHPMIARHGSISLTVNYHAFRHHCESQQGTVLLPSNQPQYISVGAFLYVTQASSCVRTQQVYEEVVKHFGPDEFYSMKEHINQTADTLSISAMFATIRLSYFDSRLFYQLIPSIRKLIPGFEESDRLTMLQLIARVWEGYYPLWEIEDLAFEISLILIDLQFPIEALSFLDLSNEIYGPHEKHDLPRIKCLQMLNEE